jgi:MoaA/NifB/PqqE/SkfB family radical SAM enzyme
MGTRGWFVDGRRNPFVHAYRRLVRRERPVPRFPDRIQIQTKSGCNASCWFCPNEETLPVLDHGDMEWDLFTKIVDEVVRHPVKRISPYLMNEPLLDKEIARKIRYIADRKPRGCRIRINTNASKLTEAKSRELIESGLDQMHVSFHGMTKETYEKSMPRMQYERNLENVLGFLRIQEELGQTKPKLKITFVKTKLTAPEVEDLKRFWGERGVGVAVQALANRGDKRIQETGLEPAAWRPFTWCSELMQQGFIVWNGDLVLCCADWRRVHVLGNCRERTIESIWNDEPATALRRNFIRGDVSGQLCGTCYKMQG